LPEPIRRRHEGERGAGGTWGIGGLPGLTAGNRERKQGPIAMVILRKGKNSIKRKIKRETREREKERKYQRKKERERTKRETERNSYTTLLV